MLLESLDRHTILHNLESRLLQVPLTYRLYAGRPAKISSVCDYVYRMWIRESKQLPFNFFSNLLEGEERSVEKYGRKRMPLGYGFIEPFRTMVNHAIGMPLAAFSVLSVLGLDGTPIAGGAIELIQGRLFLAGEIEEGEEGVTSTLGDSSLYIYPSRRKTLDDEGVLIATNRHDPRFSKEWNGIDEALTQYFPKFVWSSYTGAYALVALSVGLVHGYIMLEEPGEYKLSVNAGLAFAKIAKCPVVVVKRDGTYVPYDPLPNGLPPGSEDKVEGILVAACNEGMLQSIIKEIIIKEVLQI